MDRTSTLIAAVEAHTPADPAELAHREEILALLRSDGDAFDRGRFEPGHITASGFVLSPERDRLLLLHHAKLDRWLQPGGHVEPADPTIQAASAREVLEETGVCAHGEPRIFDLDVHPIPARGEAPEHRHYDVRFLWVARDETLAPSEESLDVAWIPLEEIPGRFDSPSLARVYSKLASGAKGRLE